MTDVLLIILMIVIAGVVIIFLPQWRIRRKIPRVILIFREHNAIGIKNAKTSDELGIRLPNMLEGILTRRDYKRYALSSLIKAEIIQMTEDGRLYLSEEKLITSGLYKSQSVFR